MSFCSVIIILSFGVCIFLTLESILRNYKSSLIKKLRAAQIDVIIINNPSNNDGVKLDELFPDEIEEKTKLTVDDVQIIISKLNKVSADDYSIAPIILKDDFVVTEISQEGVIEVKTRFIALDISNNSRIFPVLEQLSEQQIEDFQNDSSEIPVIISGDICPGAVLGTILDLDFQGVKSKCRIVSVLKQNQLFPVSMVIVPMKSGTKILSDDKYTSLAIRCTGKKTPVESKELFENVLGERYWIRSWSDSIPVLDSVFNTINIFLSAIICSLFVLAFVFGIASFDILIKNYKTQLALLLSLGMPPVAIRKALLVVSSTISIISLMFGIGLSIILLKIIPTTPLKIITDILFMDDFSFAFTPAIMLVTLGMSFSVTVGAALISSRRVFRIDPIEDLRQ